MSVTTSLVAIALATLITPQIILRATQIVRADSQLFVALAAGIVFFVITLLAVNGVTILTPRRTTHMLATRYVGSWAGILVGAARILAHGLLVLLGVELVMTAVNAILGAALRSGGVNAVMQMAHWEAPIAVVLVLSLALPTLIARSGSALKWPRVPGFIGVLALVFVLGWGLVQEFRGEIDFAAVILARADALNSDLVIGGGFPLEESILGACFPAAILYMVSERVMALPERRRVPLHRMLKVLVPMFVLIALTMYFAVKLELPGRRLGLPAISIAYAFFGENGRIAFSVLFALIGFAVAISAYRQLPRVLRELAIDGLLPQRLAAEDSVVPRRLIVALIALLAAVISVFLDSTRSLAMIFILIAILIGLLLSLAMAARGSSILAESTDADERRLAAQSRLAYRAYGIVLLAVMALLIVVQPLWFVAGVLSLAVPVLFLIVHRKGLGKINEVLTAEIGSRGRAVPIRVHSFVLVDHLDLPTLKALDWARANKSSTVEGLSVAVDPARTRKLRRQWEERKIPVALTIVGTPAGAARGPIVEYVRAFRRMHPDDVVMIVIPKIISTGTWERFFVRHTTPSIISELELEPGVMITQVPYLIEAAQVHRQRAGVVDE